MKIIFIIIYILSFGLGIFSLENANKMQKYFALIVAFQTLSIFIIYMLGIFAWK